MTANENDADGRRPWASTSSYLIEIQRGTYFGEDDIERFEDAFGRV